MSNYGRAACRRWVLKKALAEWDAQLLACGQIN